MDNLLVRLAAGWFGAVILSVGFAILSLYGFFIIYGDPLTWVALFLSGWMAVPVGIWCISWGFTILKDTIKGEDI